MRRASPRHVVKGVGHPMRQCYDAVSSRTSLEKYLIRHPSQQFRCAATQTQSNTRCGRTPTPGVSWQTLPRQEETSGASRRPCQFGCKPLSDSDAPTTIKTEERNTADVGTFSLRDWDSNQPLLTSRQHPADAFELRVPR